MLCASSILAERRATETGDLTLPGTLKLPDSEMPPVGICGHAAARVEIHSDVPRPCPVVSVYRGKNTGR